MIQILTGDCRDVLRTLPEESVHCVVTSPPYFGLRDYGTGQWEGGDPSCAHAPSGLSVDAKNAGAAAPNGKLSARDAAILRGECPCGAIRIDRQIGLEPTPAEFVAIMVEVFREVRRVLRSDGTLWLNLGDSYAAKGGRGQRASDYGVKPKDLIGIPWRVAFALQADGWYLRQDIIWSKPNPMPESVRDRCTKAHEYLFLLSKSPRYYFDAVAIAETAARADIPGVSGWAVGGGSHSAVDHAKGDRANTHAASKRNSFARATKASAGDHGQTPQHRPGREEINYAGRRNKRSVWTVPTQPFREAHFATFPTALVEPCIRAGCPKGGTVLDPFGGAGTTALVADRLQRDAVLIELNPDYAAMARRRIHADAPLLNQDAA